MKKLGHVILLAAVAAVAIPATAPAAAEQRQREERRGPDVPPPPAGMGQVVFYRTSSMGMLVSCRVREGDTVVNRLPPGKYFIHQTTPGAHDYNVRSEARDNLRIEVEEGETHYVRCAPCASGASRGATIAAPSTRSAWSRPPPCPASRWSHS